MQHGGWGGGGHPPHAMQHVGPQYPQQHQQHPGQYGMVQAGTGAVQFDVGFFPLLWILFFIRPRIEIGQAMERRPWGKFRVDLPAGVHRITISFPYGLMSYAGRSSLDVQVAPGCVTQVTYRAPWIVFLSGSMWQIGPRPEGAMARVG